MPEQAAATRYGSFVLQLLHDLTSRLFAFVSADFQADALQL
jgi:hypothetical protein